MSYPRVTEILKPFTGYSNVPENILERAAARGTSVHALCAAKAKGEWIPESMISEELLGYVRSFDQWAEDQVKKFVIIEKRFCHEDLKYTGQLDFVIAGHDDKLYLVDLKTSASPQKTYPLQMAAYDFLLRKHLVQVDGAMLVYLDKTGDYPKIHSLDDMTTELHVFLAALDCWHYFHKGKKNNDRD